MSESHLIENGIIPKIKKYNLLRPILIGVSTISFCVLLYMLKFKK